MGGRPSKLRGLPEGAGKTDGTRSSTSVSTISAMMRDDDENEVFGTSWPACSLSSSPFPLSSSNLFDTVPDDIIVCIFVYVGDGSRCTLVGRGRQRGGAATTAAACPAEHSLEPRDLWERSSRSPQNAFSPPLPCAVLALAHTLPLVNRRFRSLCSTSEVLWSAALLQVLRADPTDWDSWVWTIVEGQNCCRSGSSNSGGFADSRCSPPWAMNGRDTPLWQFRVRFKGRSLVQLVNDEEELKHYVALLCRVVEWQRKDQMSPANREARRGKPVDPESDTPTSMKQMSFGKGSFLLRPSDVSQAKFAAMQLVQSRRTDTLPLLYVPQPSKQSCVRIGRTLRLNLLDPRHRPSLVAAIAEAKGTKKTKRTKRNEMKCGDAVHVFAATGSSPRPRFIWTPRETVAESTVTRDGAATGYLVELCQCHWRAGRNQADLIVMPLDQVRILEVRARDDDDEKDGEWGGVVDAVFQLMTKW